MSDTLPVIRLEIENIRASVIKCLCDRHTELEQAVNEAFNAIDVDQLVRDVVFRTVKPEVERVVSEAVEDAVKRGAVEALKSDAVWSVVNNMREIAEYIRDNGCNTVARVMVDEFRPRDVQPGIGCQSRGSPRSTSVGSN